MYLLTRETRPPVHGPTFLAGSKDHSHAALNSIRLFLISVKTTRHVQRNRKKKKKKERERLNLTMNLLYNMLTD